MFISSSPLSFSFELSLVLLFSLTVGCLNETLGIFPTSRDEEIPVRLNITPDLFCIGLLKFVLAILNYLLKDMLALWVSLDPLDALIGFDTVYTGGSFMLFDRSGFGFFL
jgi:hypothetical protein